MEQGTVTKLSGFYCSLFGLPEEQLLPFLKHVAFLRNLFLLQLVILKEVLNTP